MIKDRVILRDNTRIPPDKANKMTKSWTVP